MTNTRDIIVQLKKVREEKNLSYSDILNLMEQNNTFVSKSTLSRVFAEGSEEMNFKYEETIRPIAIAMLDIEQIEENDDVDTQAMKALLRYKIQVIEDMERRIMSLESELNKEKVRANEKLERERERHAKSIDFLKNQIELKDKRMDMLLDAVFTKDSQHKELLDLILSCPARKGDSCK